MPSPLSHGLAAIVAQSIVGAAAGFPAISVGIFAAGIISILLDLDAMEFSGNRRATTPVGHSVLFGLLWIYIISFGLYVLSRQGIIGGRVWAEGSLAAACAVGTHLALDLFSEGGVYTFPKSAGVSKWLKAEGGMFPQWGRMRIVLVRKKAGGAGAEIWLNAGICLVSLALIITILALS